MAIDQNKLYFSVLRKHIFVFLLLLTCLSNSYSQNNNISFDHITVEQGLSQSTVFSIVQDAKGFIWMATRDGLNRYDSHEIKVYRKEPKNKESIPSNLVYALLTDSKGQLWIGTNHGVCIYHPELDNFKQIQATAPGKTAYLSNNTVNAILEDNDKNIWIATRNGLNLLPGGDVTKIIHFAKKPDNSQSLIDDYVRTLFQDRNGDIWAGTLNGLSKFTLKRQNDYLISNYTSSARDQNTLNDNWINSIVEGDNETLWIGTEKGGLNIFDKKSNIFYSQRNKSQNSIYQQIFSTVDQAVRVIKRDNNGRYWIGAIGGLFIFDPVSRQLNEFYSNSDNASSLSNNSIRSIYIDNTGSYWIGTHYGGVNIFSSLSKQFDHFKQMEKNSPLRYKMASAMYEDYRHDLWLSIDGGGIIHWDRQRDSYETFKHRPEDPGSLSHNNIKCICPDGTEGLWIGTFNGLNYFSFKSRKFTHYFSEPGNPNAIPNDRIYDIKSDIDGTIWIATFGGGLCRYNKKDKKFESFHLGERNQNSINPDELTCLRFDSKNRLWIGSSTGVNIRLQNGKIIHFPNNNSPKGISGKFILSIYEDHLKRIWLGTRGYGLYVFNEKTLDFKNYTTENGLPGNNIVGTLEDDKGFLWISSDNGISKFDPGKESFRNYSKSDGLICKEFNTNSYLKDAKGYMYFGGYDGIVIFHPDNIKTNSSIPSLVLTKLKLFNNEVGINTDDKILEQSIATTKLLKLKYNQNVFSIEFALLNYINPAKNQYAYKLEGFEKEWNIGTTPVATYMNLSPGRYTLLVKGCNNDGIWNEVPTSITIKVLPPLWKTWWAFLIYILILLAIFLMFVRFTRVRLKLEQELYLEHLENTKQNELHLSKLRFFTNISHEIRTPLTLIISPLKEIIDRWDGDKETKKRLNSINNNAQRLLRLINQLLDFRKQETGNLRIKVSEGNIVGFLDEIITSFNEYAFQKNIALSFYYSGPEIKLWYDRPELEKVFSNLLSNAFKFVPEQGGNVDIRLTLDGQWVTVTIEDNGKGISGEHLDKIFDRFYQVENSGMEDFGFGIGLSLTKGIVEMHHGEITVESKEPKDEFPGKTTFTVKLPLGNSHFSPDEIRNEYKENENIETYIELKGLEKETEEIDSAMLNGKKNNRCLLIVDDNMEIRGFLTERFKEHYTVLEAEDGLQAWDIATEHIPDLIISDVVMPKLDGIVLTNRLKNDERTSHIPVILLTARNEIDNELEGLGIGADEYLTKPFNINILELKVRNILAAYNKLKSKYSRIITLEPTNTEISSPEEKFLQRLLSIIEKHIADPEFHVSQLVDEIGMSRPVLFRKLKALTDMSIIDLIRTTRLKRAAALLKQKNMTISEVSYAVGFIDSKYFSKTFRQQYGKTPSEFMSES